MVFHNIGFLACRDCGKETNCADLVAGLCPECSRRRAARLSDLQISYQGYLEAGDAQGAARVADAIRAYQQSEGVRLKDVPDAYRVR